MVSDDIKVKFFRLSDYFILRVFFFGTHAAWVIRLLFSYASDIENEM